MAVFDATYVSADSFTVAGDVEQYFPAGVIVRVDCGGWVYSPVDSSVYSSPNTTVTLEDSVLTSPCGYAEISTCSPDGVPIHDHSDSSSGGSGVVGTAPAHEVSGNMIRFRNPNGTWGSWINISANVEEESSKRISYDFLFWGA
jgi:hypothetical protein